jgi:2-polyprenyl-3-methyl-5-hydroxy-6-metoxy-1,4-benzoquinol methylase
VAVVVAPDGLTGLLGEQDLVITHFGLTAFEAAGLGVPVILFNPTPYHSALAVKAGFPEIGVKRVGIARLEKLLASPERFTDLLRQYGEFFRQVEPLEEALEGLGPGRKPVCPACGDPQYAVLARFPTRTYARCARCSLVHLFSFAKEEKKYGEEYFFSEYKAQYGRTYLEDFNRIKAACRIRLKTIAELVPGRDKRSVLDIGCAYGPFLSACQEAGFDAIGLDISQNAVDHVNKELGLKALAADFERADLARYPEWRDFKAVTMWYVIEHFRDLDAVLGKVNAVLGGSGIFAFSTPNGRGISGRKNRARFLEASPADHFTVWSPAHCGKVLKKFGFKVEKIRITGHHPERFPFLPSWRGFWGLASRVFGLGDTFEVYARKIKDIGT